MIYAFNFTGTRDEKISALMVKTLKKYCPNLGGIDVYHTTGKLFKGHPYGNGFGWPASLMKLDYLKQMVEKYKPTEKDFILSVDSDVVFCNSKVFEYINPEYGIIGIMHQGELTDTEIGKLHHMSGCSIYIRGDIATKMAGLSDYYLEQIQKEFRKWVLCENEDVLLSYLAQKLGAKPLCLPIELHHGDFEGILNSRDLSKLASFYHYNYAPTSFLGVRCTGKWDFADILEMKRIKL